MISVAEARERILSGLGPVGIEQVSIAQAEGRVLAADVAARVTQPPRAVSAMDGYAVRAADIASVPTRLRIVGKAPAGRPFSGAVRPGEAVRIFTGAPMPEGSDTVVIQEDTEAGDDHVVVKVAEPIGRWVRRAGLDFAAGAILLKAGTILTPRDIGLCAAMNVPWVAVRRKPRIAILATGDEIVQPGEPIGPGQIVSSNAWALAALVRANGADPVNIGIAPDESATLQTMAASARGADLLVTTGGASVGEHDIVQSALGEIGLSLDFWKIAMRPGKPLMFGRIGQTPLLGLPGNPVSSLICSLLFLLPAMAALLGSDPDVPGRSIARLDAPLGPNDRREDYLRAELHRDGDCVLRAKPFAAQDNSMMTTLARADGLIVRPPHAPAAAVGESVEVIPFRQPGLRI